LPEREPANLETVLSTYPTFSLCKNMGLTSANQLHSHQKLHLHYW